MDIKSPRKSGGKFPKPSVVSPVKDNGKLSLGFRGFKIINSNIRLVKQVDVRTPIVRKTTSEQTSASTSVSSDAPTKKLTTAESLKKLRERVLLKKQHEEITVVDPEKETLEHSTDIVLNGLCVKVPEALPADKSAKASDCKIPDMVENEMVLESSKISEPPNSHSDKKKTTNSVKSEKTPSETQTKVSPTKDKGERVEKSKKNHSSERNEKKSRPETSSSCRSHSHKHDSSYRKNRERSRSPHHDREHRHHKPTSYNSSKDRSPYYEKEPYSSNKASSSRKSSHHSRRRQPTYVRKYSVSQDSSRSNETSKAHSHSRGHHDDKRKSHIEDDKYHRRSSSHRREDSEKGSSSHGKSSTENKKGHREKKRSSHSRQSEDRPKLIEKKVDRTLENKKHSSSEEMFSKLSFALLNEEEEFEEVEHTPQKEKQYESEAADTDLESFHTINDTESSEVDTLCEDELPFTKVIDEVGADTADSNSIISEEDGVSLNDSLPPVQHNSTEEGADSDAEKREPTENAVDFKPEKKSSPFRVHSLREGDNKPSDTSIEHMSDDDKVLFKVTGPPIELTGPTVVSLDTKCDISCDSIEQQSTPVGSEIKTDKLSVGSDSVPDSIMPRDFANNQSYHQSDDPMEEERKITETSTSEVQSDVQYYGTSSPSSTITETNNKILDKPGLLLDKKTESEDSIECRSTQSDISPVRLTPYAKDTSSQDTPTLGALNGSSDHLSNTVTEKVLSPGNKIHAMASQLKDVFNSLLQTDFKADEAKINSVEKLNGLVSYNSSQIPEICKVEENDQSQTVPVLESAGLTEKSVDEVFLEKPCSFAGDTPHADKGTVLEESRLAPEPLANNDANDCGMLPTTPTFLHSTSTFLVISPDKGAKVSPHKLKLHATTRTPLPAKKSYVQQVQKDNQDATHSSSDLGVLSLAARLMDPSDSEFFGISSSSDAEMPESKLSDVATSLAADSLMLESDSHCEKNLVVENQKILPAISDSALSRQDSSGSSANDNEEGPRRSARIRTKKTEKILKKQVSIENNGQNHPVINDTSESIKFMHGAIDSRSDATESRLPDNLSKEELFRARINVAHDTTDCPEVFDLLEENLYLTSMKKSRARKEIRRMVCDCALEETADPGGPCGENCLNRLLMIECSSRCHYGDRCTNKRFQQRTYAPSEVFKTNFKGWGIRAAADIEQGELVMEYCGEVVDQREFTRRSLEYSKSNHAHFYFMALSQDELIDATYKGNSSRFINHSCDPNAETQKWTVNGRLRVGFFTLRRIEKGEEITFDYQFERYGKVAQKCFCGTAKCRGYLGKAPDEDGSDDTKLSRLLSNEALSPLGSTSDDSPEKAQQKKKKLEYFADDTMEKDISKLLGGLRSTKEVLTLSRLMVRCDTHTQRIMCLRVLKETTSQTRLKTFLQFHGLSIIWSWMVDISGVEDGDSLALKLEIINTLCTLPITNKNIIEDSKVLPVVQRWAKPETKESSQEDSSPKEEEAASVVKENQDGDVPPGNDLVGSDSQDLKVTIKPITDEDTKYDEPPKTPSPNEDGLDDQTNDTDVIRTNETVLAAAASLLDSWKDLREIYRIPKRQKPLPSPNNDSSSRDNSVSRNSSPVLKQSRFDESEQRAYRIGHTRRGSSQERWRDASDRLWDYKHRDKRTEFTDNQFSPGSSNSSENRKEVGRRKRRFSTDSDDISKEVPWHCRAPRNNIKMSRQEYRRRFEKDVEKREQEKKRMEEQMEAEMAQNSMFPIQNQQYIGGMSEEIQPLMVGQPISGATFTPSGFSGNLIQINPTQPAPLIVDPYLNLNAGQQVSVMHHVIQQQQNPYPVQVPIQPNYDVSALYGQDPNLQPSMFTVADPNMIGQQHVSNPGQQIFNSNAISMVQPQLQPTIIQPQQPSNNNVTILGSQNGQAIVLLSAEQLQKLTQGDLSVLKESVQGQSSCSKNSTDEKQQGKSEPQKTKESKEPKLPTQLPPNWKTATDDEGRVYYYHAITRQTQWDPPTRDGKEEDLSGKREAENMDLSSTPTHDERWAKSSKNKNDGVTDEGRKAKETFRLKMSQFVVQCLSSYRKPDKKVGRITSTEDFKHLARKLTHNVMEKELKQVRVFEDLDFNANVKHKTKEYVKKYMSKVGPIYKIKDDT